MSTYPIDIAPSVLDVAALLRARTKDSNGMEVGTFNDDTRPTSAQVLTLIDQAVADVQAWLGPNPPPELAAATRVAASLEAAGIDKRGPYHLRHTFATEALAAGMSIFQLSRVMGASVKTIDEHYGHLAHDSEDSIRALLNARAKRSGVDLASDEES
jgi:integrase